MMITVKNLIEMLQKEDPNRIVVLPSKGDSHSPLDGLVCGGYRAEASHYGSFEVGEETVPALCLVPVD